MDAITVVQRYLELLERRDLDALDDVIAEDLVVHGPDGTVVFHDRETWKQGQQGSPFAEERITPVQIVSDGQQVAVRYTVTAVHSGGEAFGIAPTGNQIATEDLHPQRRNHPADCRPRRHPRPFETNGCD